MAKYVPKEYPKYLPAFDVIVQSAEEEAALQRGEAEVYVIKAATGDQRSVVLKGTK